MNLRQLIGSKRIVVCAGPGGVGKTTTAAALGVAAARSGRSTLVATIDPAPRLVDALALSDLGPHPKAIPTQVARDLSIANPESLSAARIDPRHTFDALVTENLGDQRVRERILSNNIYRQITTTLPGAHEFAATLALHAFAQNSRYDLIVLDTPPTSNAMDFFEAPARIHAAIESPMIRWLVAERPSRPARFLSLRSLSSGGALVLRKLGRLVGSGFLDDLSVFLADFEPLFAGFLARTRAVDQLLRTPEVSIVLVSAPEGPAIDEALLFARRIGEVGLQPSGFVVNRLWPRIQPRGADDIEDRLAPLPSVAQLDEKLVGRAAALLHEASEVLSSVGKVQDAEVARLRQAYPECPVTTVPLVESSDSLAILRATTEHLLA